MKNIIRFIVFLVVALVVLVLVRMYVCTVVTVGDNQLVPDLVMGDRALLYRLAPRSVERGNLVAFGDSTLSIGRVKALPGDTIRVDTLQYQIPDTCCSRCDCEGCQLLLVQVGKKETLVKRKQLRGRVYRLFNLNLW